MSLYSFFGKTSNLQHTLDEENDLCEQDLFIEKSPSFDIHKRSSWPQLQFIGIHLILLLFNIALFLFLWRASKNHITEGTYVPNLVSTPARNAIAYEAQQWDSENVFFSNGSVNPNRGFEGFGPPSPQSDAAWTEILQSSP
ncbi:uncharacterized protein KY384_003016 [Bacidia gigantensis]|uniref:uncharacterized protein n=1 Tax=Bacidia gigantensis TaxID=2732470 RepID=UPI001D03A30A|nr:uncharacterized protein KY384_003016 [Bacidia gigantensis]KAG8531387.1 hypothetical protein KY384_003016 [Bacidia gigantensis]